MSTCTNFIAVVVLLLVCSTAQAQLSPTFYAISCPLLQTIVRTAMTAAVLREPRMGASILRLFFHDCFVNGCDASILLEDTATFTGEQTAIPNQSLRGYEVIDTIKTAVELACSATVSCADILALATRDGVNLLGGPTWTVPLGRRDARTASLSATSDIPPLTASLTTLTSAFSAKGLNGRDLTALSGSHTIGQASCVTFRDRIYNDANIEPGFAATLRQQTCPTTGGDGNLAPLDIGSPIIFDNRYYQNLVTMRGLLHTDQELFNNGTQDNLVRSYSTNNALFATDFAAAMIRMGNIDPLTGTNGEIRRNCRRMN